MESPHSSAGAPPHGVRTPGDGSILGRACPACGKPLGRRESQKACSPAWREARTSRGRDDGLRAILEAAAAAQKTATVAQEIAARLCQEALAKLEER
jgi:hypothetical protein